MSSSSTEKKASPLLALPAELRNRIYRETFDNGGTVKVVSTTFPEPPLLSVCKQTRAEAGAIFFTERKFEVDMAFYSSDAMLAFNQKARLTLAEFGIRMKEQRLGNSTPHWRDFLTTLRRVHRGKSMDPIKKVEKSMSVRPSMCLAMLETARDLRDVPWPRVEQILEGLHKVLVKLDPRWDDNDN